ncbi:MAG: DNA-3-methyladenine glycosylase 2 family protein, partial [Chloroflexota bacterium]|nr:DNA-3-methyladenine glycosylase 2 family protein [Chloroflexota bacterium]
VIHALDHRFPGIRPVVEPDPFTALVRSISAQQVNLTWAAVTRRRLAEAFGQRHEIAGRVVYSYSPARLVTVEVDDIRRLQFTTTKARSILAVAASLLDGTLDPAMLAALSEDEVVSRLIVVYGIGRWSAEWYLARTLGRPVVVAGDLGVRKVVGAAYLGGALPSESEARAATAHWGGASGVAQQLLLHALVEGLDIKALAG